MQSKWLLAGLAVGIALVVGGCPTPPPVNGNSNGGANSNLNGTANENVNGDNDNLNANENAGNANTGNENANTGGGNENVNAGQNANANAGGNENTNAGSGNENANGNPSNSNSNANINSNENSNGGGSAELQAVADVTHAVANFGAVLNALGVVSDPLVNFDMLGNAGDLSNSSDPNPCPVGFWVGASGVMTFDLDWGAGCAVPQTNNETISGKITMVYTRNTNTGVVSFQNLVINGRAITGNMTLVITGGGLTGHIAYDGTVNVTSGGDRTVSGTVNGTITIARVITLNGDDLTVTVGGAARTVDLTGVMIDGVSEPNFAPRGGAATIDGSGLQTSSVIFSADTPDTGVVSVSIGGGAAANFDIPGIGS
jgi:hypothetical protein